MLTYTKAAFRAMALNAGLLGTVCAFGSGMGAPFDYRSEQASINKQDTPKAVADSTKQRKRHPKETARMGLLVPPRIAKPRSDRKLIVVDQPFPYAGALLVNGASITLASLRGRKVVLDLFSSSCIVCFGAMPKTNQLYLKYKDRLEVLLIGQLDQRIEEIYTRLAAREGLKLQVAYDSLLFQQVDFAAFPSYVWLDEQGIVRALTDHRAFNEDNIERFLGNESVTSDPISRSIPMDVSRPFLLYGNGGADSAYLYRSVLAPYVRGQRGLSPSSLSSFEDSPVFQTLGNPLNSLFSLAYFGSTDWRLTDSLYGNAWPVPLVLDGINPADAGQSVRRGVLPDGDQQWNYSFSTGDGSPARVLVGRALRAELEASFGYRGEIVTLPMPYWSIQRTPAWEKLQQPPAAEKDSMTGSINGVYVSGPIWRLVDYIRNYPGNTQAVPLPILDETGIKERHAFLLEVPMTNMENVQSGLPALGLALVKKEKLMRVLVLRKVE